ncbi:hypothetical protein VE00_01711 [Pseudogymnoascus sp. WSF 3629]|nr:hypothetical protein VE00_01711 [Pseudogymnoascus sp. WSF 3629]
MSADDATQQQRMRRDDVLVSRQIAKRNALTLNIVGARTSADPPMALGRRQELQQLRIPFRVLPHGNLSVNRKVVQPRAVI